MKTHSKKINCPRRDWEDFQYNLAACIADRLTYLESDINYYKCFFHDSPASRRMNDLLEKVIPKEYFIDPLQSIVIRFSLQKQSVTIMQIIPSGMKGADVAIYISWRNCTLHSTIRKF